MYVHVKYVCMHARNTLTLITFFSVSFSKCHWLKRENLFFSVINYEVTVVTGDVTFAGTNAKVFAQIYGDKGKTEVITLESRSNNFERNTTEIFKVKKAWIGFSDPKMHLTSYIWTPKKKSECPDFMLWVETL